MKIDTETNFQKAASVGVVNETAEKRTSSSKKPSVAPTCCKPVLARYTVTFVTRSSVLLVVFLKKKSTMIFVFAFMISAFLVSVDCFCQCTPDSKFLCLGSLSVYDLKRPCEDLKAAVIISNSESICDLCLYLDQFGHAPVTVSTTQCECLEPCCDRVQGCFHVCHTGMQICFLLCRSSG